MGRLGQGQGLEVRAQVGAGGSEGKVRAQAGFPVGWGSPHFWNEPDIGVRRSGFQACLYHDLPTDLGQVCPLLENGMTVPAASSHWEDSGN